MWYTYFGQIILLVCFAKIPKFYVTLSKIQYIGLLSSSHFIKHIDRRRMSTHREQLMWMHEIEKLQ